MFRAFHQIKFCAVLCAGLVCAAPSIAAVDDDEPENIVGDRVVLRALDKVTATTEDYTVKVGEQLTYGSLTIDVKHCEKKPPEEIPEIFAFLQIFEDVPEGELERAQAEDRVNEAGQAKLFSGWMLASKPAISALDHPVYDVWVLGCRAD